MTRQEAIQYAEDKLSKGLYRLELGYLNRGLYQITAREVDFMRAAIAALREQDATDTNVGHKWISVEERLPEECVPVLIYEPEYARGYKSMATAFRLNRCWHGCVDGAVTHWMPLPEPPKEEV